jgi:hypothetical protein
MRRASLYIAAAVVLLGTSAVFGAPLTRKTVVHTHAHTPNACATSLDACPAAGCGGGDPSLNVKKNVLQVPTGEPKEFTFQNFVALETERPSDYTPGDREEIEHMGEDTYVALNGYMIGAHPGGPETCNCKLSGEANNDFHINLVDQKGEKFTDSVVVEMTPKIRTTHPNWTLANLQNILDDRDPPYVRVTGMLLLDTEHIHRSGGPRMTIWEIHPVMNLQVCTMSRAQCDAGRGWKELD